MFITQFIVTSAGPAIDPDAAAFIAAAGITDPTQQAAIVGLVADLKGSGLWSRLHAIYPFVGGTPTSHKFNLRNAADTDAAHRITFSGSFTNPVFHSANSVDTTGAAGIIDTHYEPSAYATNNDTHIALKTRTTGSQLVTDFGVYDGTQLWQMAVRGDGFGGHVCDSYGDTGGRVSAANSSGEDAFYIHSRTASNVLKVFKNGTQFGTTQTTTQTKDITLCPYSLYIGSRNDLGTQSSNAQRQYDFATIGLGLDDTQAGDLSTAVATFTAALGR